MLLSDHTGGKHKSIAAKYFIPGIIFSEEITPVSKVNRYVSQRDFSPTVLELLGLPASRSFTGKSLLAETQDVYFADYFDAGSVGWITGDSLVETSVNKPSDMKCYSLENGLVDATPYSVMKVIAPGQSNRWCLLHIVRTCYSTVKRKIFMTSLASKAYHSLCF